ncbi:STM4014 family protein [Streptomyces oceani]|uniref:STM4014 family protein n=1 Tax=Streptomyces oceani TaxID=1075402 RepID=UPI0009A0BE31|nr:STM4014 family protein [Streptomyces oceani]
MTVTSPRTYPASASSRSVPEPRFAVVGIPGNRRVRGFQAALRQAGLPAARVVPWAEVLRGTARFRAGETVRLDSPGEDPEVDRLLRDVSEPTRVEGTGRWYARFLSAAHEVAAGVAEAGGTLLDDPAELAVLFDKRRCHGVLAAAGVPVPESPTSGGATPVRDWSEARRLLRDARLSRAFVKLAHGSSASGVLAVQLAGPGRIRADTSVERGADGRLFNSLRVRRYATEREVAALVDTLAPDGLHLERWLPKASQHGRAADLRVVVVAGRATHAVVRTSPSPMTNLHLGGRRGDLAEAATAVRAAGGDWSEALALCERAAACFPGTLCVAVDLLPVARWKRFAVCEVNAFGDLLPGLLGLPDGPAEGRDTYAAQLDAVRASAGHPVRASAGRPVRASAGRPVRASALRHAAPVPVSGGAYAPAR